jgi:hypothetical protein
VGWVDGLQAVKWLRAICGRAEQPPVDTYVWKSVTWSAKDILRECLASDPFIRRQIIDGGADMFKVEKTWYAEVTLEQAREVLDEMGE